MKWLTERAILVSLYYIILLDTRSYRALRRAHLCLRTRQRSGAGHGGETPPTSKLRTVRAATENSEQKTPGTQFWRGQTMEPWAFGTDVALNCSPLTTEVVSNIHAKVHTCTHNAHLRLIARHTSDTII